VIAKRICRSRWIEKSRPRKVLGRSFTRFGERRRNLRGSLLCGGTIKSYRSIGGPENGVLSTVGVDQASTLKTLQFHFSRSVASWSVRVSAFRRSMSSGLGCPYVESTAAVRWSASRLMFWSPLLRVSWASRFFSPTEVGSCGGQSTVRANAPNPRTNCAVLSITRKNPRSNR